MTTRESDTMPRANGHTARARRRPMPLWLAVLSIVAAVLLTATAWRFISPNPASEPPPDAGLAFAPGSRTPTPTSLPTELPPVTAPGGILDARNAQTPASTAASTAAATQPETTLPLPTVTPSPEISDIPLRAVRISGVTTLRLALSGREFESTGRPLRFTIEPRTHAMSGGAPSVDDAWCLQMGPANLGFDLQMSLHPATDALTTQGSISLRAGFCDNPGAPLDSVEVNLSTPTGSAAQIAYNLRGDRALFGEPNLLNADVGVIVELEVTNPRPR